MAVHPLAVTVKDRQIPGWVRSVPNPPHKNRAAMFTKLRWDKTPFVDINDRNPTRLAPGIPSTDPWTCYLDDLAARAEELDQQNCSRSLLDLTIPLQLPRTWGLPTNQAPHLLLTPVYQAMRRRW